MPPREGHAAPLALCPEARNRAGVTHPHHLLLGSKKPKRV
jgi:hypothetical protein